VPEDRPGFHFKVSANLLRIIGQELVASDEIAVLELVKNAYDSNARKVTISIEPVTEKKVGFIKIADDGQGMSRGDFDRLFMLAASSQRPDEPRMRKGFRQEKRVLAVSPPHARDRLRVLTRADVRLAEALEVTFDWRKFRDKNKQFEQIRIPYEMAETSELPGRQTGTILEITGLGNTWERSKIEGLRVSWLSYYLRLTNRLISR